VASRLENPFSGNQGAKGLSPVLAATATAVRPARATAAPPVNPCVYGCSAVLLNLVVTQAGRFLLLSVSPEVGLTVARSLTSSWAPVPGIAAMLERDMVDYGDRLLIADSLVGGEKNHRSL
jgi:hypothetical protein